MSKGLLHIIWRCLAKGYMSIDIALDSGAKSLFFLTESVDVFVYNLIRPLAKLIFEATTYDYNLKFDLIQKYMYLNHQTSH